MSYGQTSWDLELSPVKASSCVERLWGAFGMGQKVTADSGYKQGSQRLSLDSF